MSWRKIGVVASAEFGMLARTKAFIITLVAMPLIVAGSVVAERIVAKQVDITERKFAVVDRTGVLHDDLARAVESRNSITGGVTKARFVMENVDPSSPGAQPLALSDRVRRGEIFAFVDLPATLLDPAVLDGVRYYSDHPTYEDLRTWLDQTVNEEVRARRLQQVGVDPKVVSRVDIHVPFAHLGLSTLGKNGEVQEAAPVDMVRTYFVPLGLMYILFMTIFMSAPQMMNAVMQEKMSKISEVLLGSVSPFELMMGKLIGGGGMSLVLALVYLTGAMVVALKFGYGSALSPFLLVSFLVFMSMAVLFYGSIFVAVGSACSDLKDAQSLIMPVTFIAILPMFAWQAVLKSPASTFSVAASLFPPATPFLMMLRLAIHPGPPVWQVVLSVGLTAGTTVLMVWAAGRIFRIGILAQGKSAGFAQLARWVMTR